MRSIALSLDFEDSSLPPAGKTANLFPYPLAVAEDGAVAHWVFDRGGEDSFVDRVSGQVLTPQSDTYAFTENSVVLDGSVGNGLLTPVTDSLGLLMFIVARKPTQGSAVFGGSIGPVGQGGFGLNATDTTTIGARQRGPYPSGSLAAQATRYGMVAGGEWFFAAMYSGAAASGDEVSVFVGSNAFARTALAGTDVSERKIAIGNGYFAGQGVGATIEVAEFGLISGSYLTRDKGIELLTRAVRRMKERGITVALP